MNDLWLILIGPTLIAGIYGFAWLVDRYWGDCQHKWGPWVVIDPKNEAVYIQQRFCRKCNMRQINQIRKEKDGSAL